MQPAAALPKVISSTRFAQLAWWLSSYEAWAKLHSADDTLSHCSSSAPGTTGTWAAQYITRLLMKLTAKKCSLFFPFLFKSPTKAPDGQMLCFNARNESTACQHSTTSWVFAVPYEKVLSLCG